MKHRTAFIIASALTAFVLIFVLAITAVVTPKVAAFDPSPTPTDTSTNSPTNTASNTPTNTSTVAPSATATKANTAAPQVSVLTPDQASKIAMRLAPTGKLQSTPGLVNYQGRMAYEVLLDAGTVYIDAFSGKVLYDGTKLTSTPTQPPPTVDPGTSDTGTGGGGGGGGGGKGNGSRNPAPPSVQPPQPPAAPKPPAPGICKRIHCGGDGGGDH